MSLDFGGQPADKQAGDKAAGAKDGQVAEDVQCLCGKGSNYELSEVMAKTASGADAHNGEAGGVLECCHGSKA